MAVMPEQTLHQEPSTTIGQRKGLSGITYIYIYIYIFINQRRLGT